MDMQKLNQLVESYILKLAQDQNDYAKVYPSHTKLATKIIENYKQIINNQKNQGVIKILQDAINKLSAMFINNEFAKQSELKALINAVVTAKELNILDRNYRVSYVNRPLYLLWESFPA